MAEPIPAIQLVDGPLEEARQLSRGSRIDGRFRMKSFLKNLIASFVGCILALCMLEIFLISYNPIESTVKGNKIILPISRTYITKNHNIAKLDKVITHTKNSLGFRGEDPPHEFYQHLTIISVGGSTTECKYLSDGNTWTDILEKNLANDFDFLWVNNAGLDGHSTFGHMILMEDYILHLKPKILLFLVGVNDMGRSDIGHFELQHIRNKIDLNSIRGFIKSASSYSETFALILNIYRYYRAETVGLSHREIDLKKLEMMESQKVAESLTTEEMNNYIKNYEMRLSGIIDIAKKNGIEPVFITQPALFGSGVDDITGVDLERIRVGSIDGQLSWNILERYNEVTRKIGQKENVSVIDLAKDLPKSSKYFYDFFHFTNEGAKQVGDVIYNHLSPHLKVAYKEYVHQKASIRRRGTPITSPFRSAS
jgi:lysophospholipase L1-like esterase